MLRASTVSHALDPVPFDLVVLDHAERHLRRKVISLQSGDGVLVDLPGPVQLRHGDRLVLDDGRHIEVIAAQEALMEVRPTKAIGLAQLAWHIGNRHLPAQIDADRILVGRDHVIRDMLAGLGAEIADVLEPFQPERGAYHRHTGGDHDHLAHAGHGHHHHD